MVFLKPKASQRRSPGLSVATSGVNRPESTIPKAMAAAAVIPAGINDPHSIPRVFASLDPGLIALKPPASALIQCHSG